MAFSGFCLSLLDDWDWLTVTVIVTGSLLESTITEPVLFGVSKRYRIDYRMIWRCLTAGPKRGDLG